MFIFIYGDDTFRVHEKVEQMKTAFGQKFDPTGLNTSVFPNENKPKLAPGDIFQSVRAFPFLGKKRLVVIGNLISETTKATMQIWTQGFLQTPQSTIVIFWETLEPKIFEKKPLFLALKDASEVHAYPFPELQGSALSRFVQERITARGGKINPKALQNLIVRVGSDLWKMDQEISKLVAYANQTEISSESVEMLVHANFEGKIFELMDALSSRRCEQAIKLLKEERQSGTNDHYLLSMLGRQIRILLQIKSALLENPRLSKQELATSLSIHPFVAQKAMQQVKGFTLEKLRTVHDLLFDFDEQLKIGHINADMAVDLASVKMMK